MLDFPNNPQIDDIYTSGNQSWIWTGYAWEYLGESIGSIVGPTGVSGPENVHTGPTSIGYPGPAPEFWEGRGSTGPTGIGTTGPTGSITPPFELIEVTETGYQSTGSTGSYETTLNNSILSNNGSFSFYDWFKGKNGGHLFKNNILIPNLYWEIQPAGNNQHRCILNTVNEVVPTDEFTFHIRYIPSYIQGTCNNLDGPYESDPCDTMNISTFELTIEPEFSQSEVSLDMSLETASGYNEYGKLTSTLNWSEINVQNGTWSDLDTDDNGVWVAVGRNPVSPNQIIARSTDDGLTWNLSDPTFRSNYTAIKNDRNGVWVAIADSIIDGSATKILRSNDNGLTWNNQSDPGVGDMYYSLDTDNNNNWIIVGTTILRSSDNGQTWIDSTSGLPISNTVTEWVCIETDRNGTWVAIANNNFGRIIRSEDNGQTWTENTNFDSEDLSKIITNLQGIWIITISDDNAILRSTDNGLTWEKIRYDTGYLFGLSGIYHEAIYAEDILMLSSYNDQTLGISATHGNEWSHNSSFFIGGNYYNFKYSSTGVLMAIPDPNMGISSNFIRNNIKPSSPEPDHWGYFYADSSNHYIRVWGLNDFDSTCEVYDACTGKLVAISANQPSGEREILALINCIKGRKYYVRSYNTYPNNVEQDFTVAVNRIPRTQLSEDDQEQTYFISQPNSILTTDLPQNQFLLEYWEFRFVELEPPYNTYNIISPNGANPNFEIQWFPQAEAGRSYCVYTRPRMYQGPLWGEFAEGAIIYFEP